jgi:hypothetical protein
MAKKMTHLLTYKYEFQLDDSEQESKVIFLLSSLITQEIQKFIDTKYILELIEPLLNVTNTPILIDVSVNHFNYGISIKFIIRVKNKYPFKNLRYSLLSSIFDLNLVNPNIYYILENDEQMWQATILENHTKDNANYQEVKSDSTILGFYKAWINPKLQHCTNCKYYVGNYHLSCTVRPGHKQLCQDYEKK